ncbi:MAG: biosynthetic-type acetolactate synthase large subunit [Ruminococcaceae bacterium]|nr:biosynthetic-type acetolactate synthase large subunit [Oscillospiraceae bacterium]
MILSGADIVIEVLLEQECDVIFGYPGAQVIDIYDSLYKYKDKIKHVLGAHEQGAAHAADGYARTTGKVGVVLSTSGPGATNLVTAIATAHLDSVPLVAICGNVATDKIGTDSFQEIDITGITLPITKHNFFVNDISELAQTLREAFRLAMSGRRGPVLVDIPKDVQTALCEYTKAEKITQDEAFAAKDMRIKEAAECINRAKRPYIYFGGGIIAADAQNEMLKLAEKIDAPLGCSLMGISAIATNEPRFLGMQGMHGHYASTMAMHNADCIISLGVRFNNRATCDGENFAKNADVIHIDVDGSELCKNVPTDYGLRGDLKLTLEKLLSYTDKSEKPLWQKQIESFKQDEYYYNDKRDTLTPRSAILMLNDYLDENTAVATDVGQHQMWSAQNLVFRKNRRFLSSGGLGTMGYGLGAAIGAYFGTNERSVLVTGDGSFGMCLNELATAVNYDTDIVILIMNNGALGMVRQWQTMFFDRRYSSTVIDRKTDFTALAKAFGADGERVERIDELKQAFDRAFSFKGVYVIDCVIDKDELVLPMLPPNGTSGDIIVKVGD